MARILSLLYFGIVLAALSFAAGEIENAFYSVCGIVLTILPIAVLIVSVLSALIYAVGQIMGAETRARATVWATNLFTGALVAAIIFLLIPYVLETLGIGAITDLKTSCVEAAGGSPGTGGPGTRTCSPACPTGQICNNGACVTQCLGAGQSCGSNRLPCCTGSCTNNVCSSSTCLSAGASCGPRSLPCCFGSCTSGVCSSPGCRSTGTSCSTDSSCCSGRCSSGRCT